MLTPCCIQPLYVNNNEYRVENLTGRLPWIGQVNAPILHEGGIKVEVQRCNRTLWSIGAVENGRPMGSLLTCHQQEDLALLNY